MLTGTLTRRACLCLGGLLLAGTAQAQGADYPWSAGSFPLGDLRWYEAVHAPASTVDFGASASRRELSTLLLAPAPSEGLAARLAVEPPPVSRETLEGASEALHPMDGVPGGIVLGLVARAQGGLETELAGAHLVRAAEGGLELSLASGRRLRCPPITPELLRACLAFTASERDTLVDVTHGLGTKPRLAPAFAGGALEAWLVRMDGVPHRLRPETRAHKSLIVDRAVSFEARATDSGAELLLTAELEVRLYSRQDSGWARRVGTLSMEEPASGARDGTASFATELAPLTDLAAWLAFLRRMQQLDPAGIAALRANLGR